MAIVNLSSLQTTIQHHSSMKKRWLLTPHIRSLMKSLEQQELTSIPLYTALAQEMATADSNHDEHELLKVLFELIDKAPDFTQEMRVVETHYFDDDQEPWTCFSFEGDYGSVLEAINDAVAEHDTAFHRESDKATIDIFHQMQRATTAKAFWHLISKVW